MWIMNMEDKVGVRNLEGLSFRELDELWDKIMGEIREMLDPLYEQVLKVSPVSREFLADDPVNLATTVNR